MCLDAEEARELIKKAPVVILDNFPKKSAMLLKEDLEDVGATVNLTYK